MEKVKGGVTGTISLGGGESLVTHKRTTSGGGGTTRITPPKSGKQKSRNQPKTSRTHGPFLGQKRKKKKLERGE